MMYIFTAFFFKTGATLPVCLQGASACKETRWSVSASGLWQEVITCAEILKAEPAAGFRGRHPGLGY